jgi:predicted HTH transcriptional regulator
MTPDELRELLSEPESERLEFKLRLPPRQEVQRLLAAFANTEGGTLVVGFNEPNRQVVGLAHPGAVAEHIREWSNEIRPRPEVRSGVVTLEPGKHLAVARIERGDQVPYLAAGQALERRGDRLAPIRPEQIASRVPASAAEVSRLSEAIAEQSSQIVELLRQLHWKHQLPIRVFLAILGAVVGAVIGYVLGSWDPLS